MPLFEYDIKDSLHVCINIISVYCLWFYFKFYLFDLFVDIYLRVQL